MKIVIVLLFTATLFIGCTKMEEKKQTENKQPTKDMQNPHTQGDMQNPHSQGDMQNPHGQVDMTDMAPESAVDEKADKLVKEAKDFEEEYKKNSTEENKRILIEKNMAAGNYLMYQAELNPKKKYGPALKLFKRVLELDPKNQEAMNNKMQIEDIYNSMGRPIPQ